VRPEPLLAPDTDLIEYLLALEPDQRQEAVRRFGITEGEAFDRAWSNWAHDGQFVPPGQPDWTTWVLMAGRGFGKTLAGANWVTGAVADPSPWLAGTVGPLRIALVGATIAEARQVMIEGRSGLLAVAGEWVDGWNPSLRRLTFRTGAEAVLFSGASPEQLRGPEHHLAWCDELAKWEKPRETWDMLQFGLRLGPTPRALVTTTPRPGPLLRGIMAEPGTVTTHGSTAANPHLSPAYQARVQALYSGTRLGRQELDGELLTDQPGALWTVELLERCRHNALPLAVAAEGEGLTPACTPCEPDETTTFVRLVIGVDPPAADGTCGIIVCARDTAGHAHILADHSVTARTPEGWARAVADAARIHSCPPLRKGEGDHAKHGGGVTLTPLIVAEQNQGGKMVAAVLRTADPTLRVKPVTATVGKSERAAPIAMLFEAGKVVLHGRFPALEAELLGMIAGGGYEGPGTSPDRADAMVWALTELMLARERGEPRISLF
jgi:phage terminase large subunit-like protein